MKTNKGVIGLGLILAIVLGIAVVGGGAYYLGKSDSKKELINTENLLPNNQNQEISKIEQNKFDKKDESLITVLSPNGGERLSIGSKYDIKYKTSGAPKDAIVFLFVGLSGGDKWLKLESKDSDSFSATGGSYEWTVPKEICGVEVCTSLVSGENYKIKAILTGTINNQFQDIVSDESDNSFSINSDAKTYTYKNHGFTIELPKGYIPHEEQAEGGPAIMISLPNSSGINYLTDTSWWNKVNYFTSDKEYLRTEKIGETTFNVYKKKDSNIILYYYQKGNIGYEFFGDKKILETFKFVGWVDAKTVSTEESSTETFKNQPGTIKSIKDDGTNKWILAVDLLTHNPDWLPGVDSSGPFLLNQNTKVRNLNVTGATKSYKCGSSADGNIIQVLTNTNDFIEKIKSDSYKNRYFDIIGANITSIHEQCLP